LRVPRKPAATPAPPGRIASLIPLALLIVTALLSTWSFLARGHPAGVDVWPHLARQRIVYEALRGGFSPFYTFMLYCGFPALRFYSPLFYFLGGFLALFTGGNLMLALRALLLVLHLLSAWAMFTYLRHRTGEQWGAALGTIVYLIIPWRLLYLCGNANYPAALIYLLLPLAFLALERLIEFRDRRDALLFGLWVALLVLSHLVYALFAVLFLLVFAGVGRVRRVGPVRPTPRLLPLLGVSALVALSLSAFFLVPFLVEFRSHVYPLPRLNLGVPDVRVLLGLSIRAGGYAGVYLGLSVLLVLLAAIVAVLTRKAARRQIPAALGLLASLALTFLPTLLREKQDIITAGLPPERFLLFFVFFAALLVPSAYELLRSAFSRRRNAALAAFLILALPVMADCFLTITRGHYGSSREFLAVREDLYRIIAAEPHTRLLDINSPEPRIDDQRRIGRHPAAAFVYGNLASPLGPPYHQFAPRSMLYVYPWVNYVAGDVGDTDCDTLSTRTLNALTLMGVSHLITIPGLVRIGDANETYMKLKQRLAWYNYFLVTKADPPLAMARTYNGLALVSSRVMPMPEDSLIQEGSFMIAGQWLRLLDTLTIDNAASRLNFVPARAGRRAENLPGLPAVRVLNTRTRNQDVDLEVSVSADCFFRLAVSYYPELRILLDGRPVAFFETSDHFVYFRCPAGDHRVRAVAALTPVRQVTGAISGISLVLAALFLVMDRRRRKPRLPAAPVDG
jgi:hypothetical protein